VRQTEKVGLEHFTQSFQDSLDLTDTADKIQVARNMKACPPPHTDKHTMWTVC
jgi:hypothetical protein